MKLLGVGDNVVDYYKDQKIYYPGGNALNVTIMSKVNGAVGNGYIGIVGDDQYGDHIVKTLYDMNIDVSHIRRACGENAVAYIELDEEGDRVFLGTNKERRIQSLLRLNLNKSDLEYIKGFDVIHTSINSHIEEQLPLLSFKPISFDFSTKSKWDKQYLENVCAYIDIAFFSGSNMDEAEINSLINTVHDSGVEIVGITRGEEEAIVSKNFKKYYQKPQVTKVVDTMGAGDSFISGFLTSYFDYYNVENALQMAVDSAARTCACNGAFDNGVKVK
ncbi:PfkB family carbohydrate kinase [Salibacterium aidingense]|uniref:PfkB family carbohydrate kinase n=1 Tax=Salibacterium aidingense TaxID=384933 RepID=UPI003BE6B43C